MKKILLVDDSPTMLASISTILKKAGYECDTAADGQIAVDKVGRGLAPNLVITDYHMPGMDGVELIGKLRRLGATRFVPMLVLTTDSQPEKRSAAKAAGATGWLVKPVDPPALLQVIRQLLPAA
ncbi:MULTISPECIES: response regulator [unclassified Aureimonas]|uniref:response regulator n=1 Tax=unclassified Aureimonas TaxID=2615206 RepID=UPI0006F4ADFA|nr:MULTISPECIES: response regulator [unclassified Aureimonas]KQT69071.1 two-component system sensor histidine kinase/response regulator [Aureimonas sp. Leaf460]KQT69309.1 two-component system sensor histidine kinase/response regulator [Aureimonas sp. Leaf427]